MTILNTILLFVFLSYTIIQIINHNMLGVIGGGSISLIAFILCAFRYKHVLYNDMMIAYVWKIAAIFPILIEYKDIQSIEVKSKYHVIIKHKYESHIYVYDSKKFIETYENMKK